MAREHKICSRCAGVSLAKAASDVAERIWHTTVREMAERRGATRTSARLPSPSPPPSLRSPSPFSYSSSRHHHCHDLFALPIQFFRATPSHSTAPPCPRLHGDGRA